MSGQRDTAATPPPEPQIDEENDRSAEVSGDPSFAHGAEMGGNEDRSLLSDIEDLVEDAKTYFDAEVTYQKSRAGFVGACIKRAAAFGALAAVLVVFALFGLVFGLILALTPYITAWGATALVVLAILLVVALLVRGAAKAWRDLMQAVKETPADTTAKDSGAKDRAANDRAAKDKKDAL